MRVMKTLVVGELRGLVYLVLGRRVADRPGCEACGLKYITLAE